MSKALYNKYRSQDFDQLIGQEVITKSLKNSLIKGKVANAYLLVGTRGTGKTSTARILAKALNCLELKKDGNPCNECRNCKAITDGRFMDLIEIDAASNRGIDQIRDLKEKIEFSPTEGKYKVYIIDEVHMLTKEAFNALLKTLEEPPAHVVFILATTDVHKLPPTILSRCQRFDFRSGSKINLNELIEKVCKDEKIGITKDAVDLIIKGANGSYRDAMSLLDVVISGQKFSQNPEEVTVDEVRNILGIPELVYIDMFIEALVSHNSKSVLMLVREMEEKGVNFSQYVGTLLEVLREILFDMVTESDSKLAWVKSFTVDGLIFLIVEVLNIEKNVKYASLPAFAFEVGALDLINKLANKGGVKSATKSTVSVPKVQPTKAVVQSNSELKVVEVVKGVNKDVVSDSKTIDVKEEIIQVVNKDKPIVDANVDRVNVKDIVDDLEEDAPDGEEEDIKGKSNSLNLKDIESNWSKIVEQVKTSNSHLGAFLKSARVLELNGNTLAIEVPFSFHKDLIEAVKSRDLISAVFKDIIHESCRISCSINSNMAKKKKVSGDMLLQNITAANTSTNSQQSNSSSSSNSPYKGKPSKKIEAIFSGM